MEKYICETVAKSLFWASTDVVYLSMTMIGLLKML